MSLGFWTLLILGLYKPAARRFALIPLIPVLIFGASLIWETGSEKVHPEIVLTAEKTVARKGDSASYAAAFDAPLGGGTAGTIIQDQGEWWQIRLDGGDVCWIPESNAELVNPKSLY